MPDTVLTALNIFCNLISTATVWNQYHYTNFLGEESEAAKSWRCGVTCSGLSQRAVKQAGDLSVPGSRAPS